MPELLTFSGFGLIVLLVLSILLIIGLVNFAKLHPFFAILSAAYFFAIFGGVELASVDSVIRSGFGSLITYIGLVIILGTIIGVILEKSGAAVVMANVVIKTIGKKHPEFALGIVGWIVSIPVFCDSAFVILSPLKKSMAKVTGASMVTMTVALSVGLYASHTLVPPTPGPIAAAANYGIENLLGLVILVGMVVSFAAMLAGFVWAKIIGKKIGDEVLELSIDEELATATYGTLPNPFFAFLPILLPIVLIAIGTIANLPGKPMGEGGLYDILNFIGQPTTALLLGLFGSIPLLLNIQDSSFSDITKKGITIAAPILLITAAGGAFGAAIKATEITAYIEENLSSLSIGLLVPFIIAATLKTAQGSSTTALVVTSTIVAPLLPSLGLDSNMGAVLAVMATGAGAMTISHSNDSYFWIVAESSGMDAKTAYKTHTVASLIMGVAAISVTLILGLVLL